MIPSPVMISEKFNFGQNVLMTYHKQINSLPKSFTYIRNIRDLEQNHEVHRRRKMQNFSPLMTIFHLLCRQFLHQFIEQYHALYHPPRFQRVRVQFILLHFFKFLVPCYVRCNFRVKTMLSSYLCMYMHMLFIR